MKTYTLVVAGLLLASATAVGQSGQSGSPEKASYFAALSSHSEEYIQNAAEHYTALLSSDNDGVVESALGFLTYIRMGDQERDLVEARMIISKLSKSGRTQVIRYKAYLSTMVFESPALFAEGVAATPNEGGAFFNDIAAKVQRTLLGQNL